MGNIGQKDPNGKQLDGEGKGLISDSKVQSSLSSIYIKVRGISVKLDISLDNTLEYLKEKIHDTLQMNKESYFLYFKGRRLYTDANPLSVYDIKNNDVIKLIEKENEEILSIIDTFGEFGKDIDIPNDIQNTGEIKQLISENFFIPLNRVQIFFGEDEIIRDQNIKGLAKEGSFWFYWNKYPNEEDYVNIEVIDCNRNEVFYLNVDLYGNIFEEIKKNVSYDLFYLKYKDKYNNEIYLGPLTEKKIYQQKAKLKICSDYHYGEKIILELHKVENIGEFQIFVDPLYRRKMVVNVKPDEKIRDLKLKIFSLLGNRQPEEQRLEFACKVLEDNRTLYDYNIQKESTLRMILPLRGG